MGSYDQQPEPDTRSRLQYLGNKREALESFLDFADGRELPRHPLEIYLEVSNVCDLRCVMCPRFSALNPDRLILIGSEARGVMDVDEITGAVEQALPAALRVHVYGYGEATIHPRIAELLRFLARYEVLVELFTNGMHLDGELVSLLVETRVHRITCSISGTTRQEYESVYLGGDLQRVLAGLARLRDHKLAAGSSYPLVEVNSLSFRHHVARLDTFVELMADHGVSTIMVSPLHEHAESIPELEGHAAAPGSLGTSQVAARAERLARQRGVRLDIHGSLRNLDDPSLGPKARDAYRPGLWPGIRRRLARLRDTLYRPDVGVRSFQRLAHRLQTRQPAVDQPGVQAIDPLTDAADQVRLQLRVEPAPDPGAECPFVCLEPFKTLYLRRNGEAKACCFMQDDAPALGQVFRNSPADIWHGSGFRTVRSAFLGSEYPLSSCGNCLRNHQAPPSHRLDRLSAEYQRWAAELLGDEGAAAALEPLYRRLAEVGDGRSIVQRLQTDASALLLDPEQLDRAQRLLALLDKVAQPQGPYRSLVEGHVDPSDPDQVVGWVWSPLFPELRLPVSLYLDGRRVAETVARIYRADLVAVGKGDGRYGFTFDLEPPEPGSPEVTASVRLGDTNCTLGTVYLRGLQLRGDDA